MSEDNTARLTYLRLQSEAAAGDLILTSGYGEQIPQGLTVGYLSEVSGCGDRPDAGGSH